MVKNNSNNKSNISDFFYKIYKKLFHKNKIIKQILLWYLFISLLGALLLFSSLAQKGESNNSFLDSLFISASAFSDTGLSTIDISKTYNFFGQLIIMILIMFGGIGFFSMKVFIIHFIFRRNVGHKEREQVFEEVSSTSIKKSFDIIKVSIISMIFAIITFGIIFGIIFGLKSDQWGKSMWQGIFHANSSINNAGFDIFDGNNSMENYYSAYTVQVLTIFLFIFGGIGFGVIYDVKEYFKNRYKGSSFKFSLFTKISTISYLSIALFGLLFTYSAELLDFLINNEDSFYGMDSDIYGNGFERTWALTFNTMSTRNAGFSTIDISDLSNATLFNYTILMFIGSGPGSTAGGIRTTTFAIILLSLIAKARGKDNIELFNRRIPKDKEKISFKIFIFSFITVILASLLISIDELWVNGQKEWNYLTVLFLTSSAFGTTGLSIISIENIGIFTEILLILIMFIGQVGMASLIRIFRFESNTYNKNKVNKTKLISKSIYIEEDVAI